MVDLITVVAADLIVVRSMAGHPRLSTILRQTLNIFKTEMEIKDVFAFASLKSTSTMLENILSDESMESLNERIETARSTMHTMAAEFMSMINNSERLSEFTIRSFNGETTIFFPEEAPGNEVDFDRFKSRVFAKKEPEPEKNMMNTRKPIVAMRMGRSKAPKRKNISDESALAKKKKSITKTRMPAK